MAIPKILSASNISQRQSKQIRKHGLPVRRKGKRMRGYEYQSRTVKQVGNTRQYATAERTHPADRTKDNVSYVPSSAAIRSAYS